MNGRGYQYLFALIGALLVITGGFLHVPFWLTVIIALGVSVGGAAVYSRSKKRRNETGKKRSREMS